MILVKNYRGKKIRRQKMQEAIKEQKKYPKIQRHAGFQTAAHI